MGELSETQMRGYGRVHSTSGRNSPEKMRLLNDVCKQVRCRR